MALSENNTSFNKIWEIFWALVIACTTLQNSAESTLDLLAILQLARDCCTAHARLLYNLHAHVLYNLQICLLFWPVCGLISSAVYSLLSSRDLTAGWNSFITLAEVSSYYLLSLNHFMCLSSSPSLAFIILSYWWNQTTIDYQVSITLISRWDWLLRIRLDQHSIFA